MSEDKKNQLYKVGGNVSYYHGNMIEEYSKKNHIPVTQIVGCLVEQAIEAGFPLGYDLTLPELDDDSYCEYPEEGGKILKYMGIVDRPLGLNQLLIGRYDIGVSSKKALLNVISDCVRTKLIEKISSPKFPFAYSHDYFYYRLSGHEGKVKRKNRSKMFTLEEENKELKAKLKERE